jgi:hypothetical protein
LKIKSHKNCFVQLIGWQVVRAVAQNLVNIRITRTRVIRVVTRRNPMSAITRTVIKDFAKNLIWIHIRIYTLEDDFLVIGPTVERVLWENIIYSNTENFIRRSILIFANFRIVENYFQVSNLIIYYIFILLSFFYCNFFTIDSQFIPFLLIIRALFF